LNNIVYLILRLSACNLRRSALYLNEVKNKDMKKDIHPKYNSEAQVVCACGNKFAIGSTQEKIEVEICSACHPFYTGNEKVMDTAGRVDKFKKRMEVAKTKKAKDKK